MTKGLLRNSPNQWPLRRAFLLIPLALACFALLPTVRAVSPAPDGGYPGNNTAEGANALNSLTTGSANTATGVNALLSNTTGVYNTANGLNALAGNTTGSYNTANGGNALLSNTTASANTATGVNALLSNTTGVYNTANGLKALFSNTTGNFNTANGGNALFKNTANDNTATGTNALFNNTTGSDNTANGFSALENNTTASNNTAHGSEALLLNTTGGGNTAVGALTLLNNVDGSDNTAVGTGSGQNLIHGFNNTYVGNFEGSVGAVDESSTIRIGDITENGFGSAECFIGGIFNNFQPVNGTTIVEVTLDLTNDHLGWDSTSASSARFKDEIKPMDKTSEAILALKPVTFRYKKEIDRNGIPQFGLVAEDVEKVNPDLVTRGRDGKLYTVRYDAVNAMLLNEFLKEHRRVEEQGATIAKQQKQIEALTTGLQKVSAEVEANKPAPQVVDNNQ